MLWQRRSIQRVGTVLCGGYTAAGRVSGRELDDGEKDKAELGVPAEEALRLRAAWPGPRI
jgi:hypothetical protein